MARLTLTGRAVLRRSVMLSLTAILGMTATRVSASAPRDPMSRAGITPANFVKTIDNPYLPMKPGTSYIYVGRKDGQVLRNVVQITHEVKTILGVSCVVVRDRVLQGGKPIENTADWYAQDRAGNVWYFGEASHDLRGGRVISTDGSFQAGVQGARAGIVMPAHPYVGQSYAQEYRLHVAQDHAKVLYLHRPLTVPFGSFRHALVTKEWTPLEPGVIEYKAYARGVGNISTVMVKGGSEFQKLVAIQHGP